MPDNIIEVKNLHKHFGNVQALNGVSLTERVTYASR